MFQVFVCFFRTGLLDCFKKYAAMNLSTFWCGSCSWESVRSKLICNCSFAGYTERILPLSEFQ